MVAKSKKPIKKSNKSNCSRAKLLSKDGKEFIASCVEHIAKKNLASRDGSGRTSHGVAEKL
jgi:hypothetical protein